MNFHDYNAVKEHIIPVLKNAALLSVSKKGLLYESIVNDIIMCVRLSLTNKLYVTERLAAIWKIPKHEVFRQALENGKAYLQNCEPTMNSSKIIGEEVNLYILYPRLLKEILDVNNAYASQYIIACPSSRMLLYGEATKERYFEIYRDSASNSYQVQDMDVISDFPMILKEDRIEAFQCEDFDPRQMGFLIAWEDKTGVLHLG